MPVVPIAVKWRFLLSTIENSSIRPLDGLEEPLTLTSQPERKPASAKRMIHSVQIN